MKYFEIIFVVTVAVIETTEMSVKNQLTCPMDKQKKDLKCKFVVHLINVN